MRFLRTCCCGCTLRTGTLIIGSLSLIFSILYLSLIIVAIPLVQQLTDQANREISQKSSVNADLSTDVDLYKTYTFESEQDVIGNDLPPISMNSEENLTTLGFDLKTFTVEILSVCAVGASISLIASILLVIGAAKGYKWLLMPWIAYVSLACVISIVSSVYEMATSSQEFTAGTAFFSILVMIGEFALDMYLLIVVISHFEELRKTRKEEENNLGKIYSAPGPWSSSTTQIIPYISEKEKA